MSGLALRIAALAITALVAVAGALLGGPLGAVVGILLSTGVAIALLIRDERAEEALRREAEEAQRAAAEALREATRRETSWEQQDRLRRDASLKQSIDPRSGGM